MRGRWAVAVLTMIIFGGCSAVPNMDAGTSRCSNAVGIGPRDVAVFDLDKPVLPEVIGLDPTAAASIAMGIGHTVVFNVQIQGFGECWCVPPPEGEVSAAFWTSRGALMLMVEGVSEGHSANAQPPTGWGCA